MIVMIITIRKLNNWINKSSHTNLKTGYTWQWFKGQCRTYLTFFRRNVWSFTDNLQRGFNCHCLSTGFPFLTMSEALAFCPFNWAFSCKSFKFLKWVQPSPDSCAMVKISLRFLFYKATHINVRLVCINSHSNISQRSWVQIPYGQALFQLLVQQCS